MNPKRSAAVRKENISNQLNVSLFVGLIVGDLEIVVINTTVQSEET